MSSKNEIRFTTGSLCIREVEPGKEGGQSTGRTVEGYAIVFNEKSQVLDDWGEIFREIVDPAACTQEFVDSCDIKMTLFHNREKLLARYMPGRENNSLHLEVDEVGVKFRFEAPHTADGDQCVELIRNNSLTGCSFTFSPDWESAKRTVDEETGVELIRHMKFKWLGEMTVGSDPAYTKTFVSARELKENDPDEKKKKAKEEEDAFFDDLAKRHKYDIY